jgi:hypothetical protein
LVLRNTDLSRLAQVQAARAAGTDGDATEQLQEAEDIQGRRVLTAYAHVAPLGWLVFVELPRVMVMLLRRAVAALGSNGVDIVTFNGVGIPTGRNGSTTRLRRHDDHPVDAEFVGNHAKTRREERLRERHSHLTAIAERSSTTLAPGSLSPLSLV